MVHIKAEGGNGLQCFLVLAICEVTQGLFSSSPFTVTQSEQTFGRRLLCRGKDLPSRPGSQHSPCLPSPRTSVGSGGHLSSHCGPGSCCYVGQMTNWWPASGTRRCSLSAIQHLVGATDTSLLTDPRNSPSSSLLPCWSSKGECDSHSAAISQEQTAQILHWEQSPVFPCAPNNSER